MLTLGFCGVGLRSSDSQKPRCPINRREYPKITVTGVVGLKNKLVASTLIALAVLIVSLVAISIASAEHNTSGLVGHWEADGTYLDSADGNDGTPVGDTTFADGKKNQAFSFDGNGDYVQIGDGANLQFTSAMTLSAWIYPTGDGGHSLEGGIIVNKEGEYEVARFHDGTIQWAIANASNAWGWENTGVIAPLSQWTHVAVVYDAGDVRVYVNGTEVDSETLVGTTIGDAATSQNDFPIGARQGATRYFQGRIDDVRVYNQALTDLQIEHQAGLEGYWPADGTALDLSGNNNNGTLNGGTGFDGSGQINEAFSFDGQSGGVLVGEDPSLTITEEFTAAGWIKPTGLTLAISTAQYL